MLNESHFASTRHLACVSMSIKTIAEFDLIDAQFLLIKDMHEWSFLKSFAYSAFRCIQMFFWAFSSSSKFNVCSTWSLISFLSNRLTRMLWIFLSVSSKVMCCCLKPSLLWEVTEPWSLSRRVSASLRSTRNWTNLICFSEDGYDSIYCSIKIY